jgi:hypothetical protein
MAAAASPPDELIYMGKHVTVHYLLYHNEKHDWPEDKVVDITGQVMHTLCTQGVMNAGSDQIVVYCVKDKSVVHPMMVQFDACRLVVQMTDEQVEREWVKRTTKSGTMQYMFEVTFDTNKEIKTTAMIETSAPFPAMSRKLARGFTLTPMTLSMLKRV